MKQCLCCGDRFQSLSVDGRFCSQKCKNYLPEKYPEFALKLLDNGTILDGNKKIIVRLTYADKETSQIILDALLSTRIDKHNDALR